MIIPWDIDITTASDEEIIEAYIKEGFSPERAKIYLAQLRSTDFDLQE